MHRHGNGSRVPVETSVSFVIDANVRQHLAETEWQGLRARFTRMARAAGLQDRANYEVCLRLCDDQVMQMLNKQYRNKDKTTDVLSFSQREGPATPGAEHVLGDIAVSVPQAARQAKGTLAEELLLLACHGLCHLLGYDHRTDDEESEMEARAKQLLTEALRNGVTRPA